MTNHWVMARLSALGDAILTTGVMRYFAENHGMSFTVLTKSKLTPIFEHHPAVDRIIGLKQEQLSPTCLIHLARQLSADKAGFLDLHGNLRTRLMSMFWSGPVRRYPKFSTARRLFILSRGCIGKDILLASSVTQRYAMALMEQPPSPSELLPHIFLTNEERANTRLCRPNTKKPIIAIHPYATHANKAWPKEFWQDLCNRLSSQGVDWIVIGQNNVPAPFLQSTGNLRFGDGKDFTNGTTLRETAALLEQVDLLISGDSGPMHLASAVGTPVVALFGPTTKEWGFFPQGPQDIVLETPKRLICRPCSLHGNKICRHEQTCMKNITPAKVLDVVLDMLKL